MKDPFDLTDVSDLPEELRPSKRERPSMWRDIIKQAPGEFTISMLRAARYRETGDVVTRQAVAEVVSRAARMGLVKRVRHGRYRYVGDDVAPVAR